MSDKKYREIELMYIEGGTFEGGEEAVCLQNFHREGEYLFVEKQALLDAEDRLKKAVDCLKEYACIGCINGDFQCYEYRSCKTLKELGEIE